MTSFKQFLESFENPSRYVKNFNTRKDYVNEKYRPLSSSEQAHALKTLRALPLAAANRRWFDTEQEIDCRDIGFVWSKNTTIKNLSFGGGRACGIATIPIKKIVAMQASIKIEGLEAYIANKKLVLPVVVEYPDSDQVSVAAGHTRIAVQALAGRDPEVLVLYEDGKKVTSRSKYNWRQ